MGKVERRAVWVTIAILGLWLLVLTLMVGEQSAKSRPPVADSTDWPALSKPEGSAAGQPTPWWGTESPGQSGWLEGPGGGTGSANVYIGVAGVQMLSDTLGMTVTVRSSGAGDLLYQPPVVVDSEGQVYQVTGDTLERARLAFLNLITRGQATGWLEFSGVPLQGTQLTLVFNPDQQPGDILSPHLEIPVPLPGQG